MATLKRSVTIAGHRTSVTLEDEFWAALKTIAKRKGVSVASIIEDIDKNRQNGLSSSLRVFVLKEIQRG